MRVSKISSKSMPIWKVTMKLWHSIFEKIAELERLNLKTLYKAPYHQNGVSIH